MKIVPRRSAEAIDAAQHEDTTTEFPAGPEQVVLRRTTVTVERETVSFFVRRPVVEREAVPAAQPAERDGAHQPQDRNLPAALPAMQNELDGGKP